MLQLPKRKIGFSILYDLGFCLIQFCLICSPALLSLAIKLRRQHLCEEIDEIILVVGNFDLSMNIFECYTSMNAS